MLEFRLNRVNAARAGLAVGAPIADLSDELYRRIMAVNLDGVFYTCRAAAQAMRGAKRGSIITIGSVFGRDTPAGSGAYGAAMSSEYNSRRPASPDTKAA